MTVPRPSRVHRDDPLVPLHEQATAFLTGDRGRSVVNRWIARYRLPAHCFDDIVQDALVRVLSAEDHGIDPDNVEAFVSTVVQRSARDLLRGRLRRPEGHRANPPADGDAWEFEALDTDPAVAVVAAEVVADLGSRVDATRAALGGHLAAGAHPAAASLTVLAIVHGDAIPAEDCPTPEGGVAAEEAVWWAGVFYAGPDGCFGADGGADDAATRKRRSRAVNAAKKAMTSAVTASGGAAGGADTDVANRAMTGDER